MGSSSTKAKNKYNTKNYDRITITIKKGHKELIKNQAKILDMSTNGYILNLIFNDITKK